MIFRPDEMAQQTALVLLLLIVMVTVNAEAPWRRRQREQWPAERRQPGADLDWNFAKRRVGPSCDTTADCDSGYTCGRIEGWGYFCIPN